MRCTRLVIAVHLEQRRQHNRAGTTTKLLDAICTRNKIRTRWLKHEAPALSRRRTTTGRQHNSSHNKTGRTQSALHQPLLMAIHVDRLDGTHRRKHNGTQRHQRRHLEEHH